MFTEWHLNRADIFFPIFFIFFLWLDIWWPLTTKHRDGLLICDDIAQRILPPVQFLFTTLKYIWMYFWIFYTFELIVKDIVSEYVVQQAEIEKYTKSHSSKSHEVFFFSDGLLAVIWNCIFVGRQKIPHWISLCHRKYSLFFPLWYLKACIFKIRKIPSAVPTIADLLAGTDYSLLIVTTDRRSCETFIYSPEED